MEPTTGRIDAGRVIGQSLSTYREYVGPLLGGAAIVIGIAAVIGGVLTSTDSVGLMLLAHLITLVASFLYTGYVVKLVQDVRDGRQDETVGELFGAAAPFLGTLVLNGVLASIAITIGFAFLIVPGLILLTIWAVISPAIVVEHRGAIEAFGRSRELVRGDGWAVFAAIVLAFLIVIAVSFVAAIIGDAIGDDAGLVIVGAIGNVATAPILALVASILFFDLGGDTAPAAPAAPETAVQ